MPKAVEKREKHDFIQTLRIVTLNAFIDSFYFDHQMSLLHVALNKFKQPI